MKALSLFATLFLLNGFLCAQRDTVSFIRIAKEKLEKRQAHISDILSDSSFDFTRSNVAFRALISQHAASHSITIVAPSEAGTRVMLKGKIVDGSGRPAGNKRVYVYQTSTLGWYGSDRPHFLESEGDRRHARLFGYLQTSVEGAFEINTIQPNGYPQSDLPAHVHFEVYDKNGHALKITELLFDDDERLKGDILKRAEREGFLIAKPQLISGVKVFVYTVVL